MKDVLVLALMIFAQIAYGNPAGTHLSGQISNSANGAPILSSDVDFVVKVLSPSGCLLYSEQHLNKNLSGTLGSFDIDIGTGSAAYNAYDGSSPQSPAALLQVFDNKAVAIPSGLAAADPGNCPSSGYAPLSGDHRLVRVEFDANDGNGPQIIAPYHRVTNVPYALIAEIADQAKSLDGKVAADFVEVSTLSAVVPANEADPSVKTFAKTDLPSCGANEVLKSSGGVFSCVPDQAGSTVGLATTSAVGVVQVGSGLSVDGAGLLSADTVAIKAVLALNLADITGLQAALDDRLPYAQIPSCGAYEVWTFVSPVGGFLCSSIAVTASQVTDFNAAVDARIAADGAKLPLAGGTMVGAINMNDNHVTNTGYITMNPSKSLHLSNNAADPTGLTAADKGKLWFNSVSNEVKYWDGMTVQVLGVAGAGITSFGGQSGSTQSLATGTTGVAPTWNSAADTHTLNIPMASAAGVTAGLLSKADYDAFAAKQPAGSYVTALTGDVTAAGPGSAAATIAADAVTSSKILNGTVVAADMDFTGVNAVTSGFAVVDATGKFYSFICSTAGDVPTWTATGFACQAPVPLLPDLNDGMIWVGDGSNDAIAVTLGGDATLSNAGVLTLANSGVTAGTYSKVTVDAKGRVTGGANIAAGDVTTGLGYTPVNKAGDVMTGSLGLGNYTNATETTLITGWGVGDKGKAWFNTSTNQVKYWDGSTVVALGVSGAGLTSLNGQTGSTQTFATPGTSGLAPAWSSAGNAHTLNIPMASAVGVTAGLLNKTDYDAFAAKQTAGNYVTALTGDVTAAGPGSAAATIAADAVTSAKIANGTIVSADMDFTGLNTATSGFAVVDSTGKFYNFACATMGHVPTWTAAGFACQAPTPLLPSLADGKVWIGDGANTATAQTLSGDAAISNAGVVTVSNVRVDRVSSAAGQYLSYKPNDVACANNEVLKWNGTGWICGTDNAGTGTVTGVTASAPLASSGGAAPVISIASGTTNGQTLRWNGTNWVAAQLSNSDVTGLGSLATKNAVDLGTADATGTLAAARMPALTGDATSSAGTTTVTLANSGVTAGTYSKVTVDAKGRVTVGANIASGDVTTALGFTPLNKAGDVMTGLLGLNGVASDPGGLTGADEGKMWFRTDTNEIKYWNGSAAVALGVSGAGLTSLNGQTGSAQTFATPGTSGLAPAWSSAGNAHTLNIPMASTASVTAGLISKTDYDSFAAKQAAGNYVTALTGDVTAAGPGSAAATIAANAVTSAKIANGTIVGADIDFTGVNTATTGFAMKDSTGKFYSFACATTGHVPTWTAAGFACQAPTPSLPTLNSANIWVGNGSNAATAVTMSGDATMVNTGAVTLATSGVTVGTYSKVTVDAKGRVTVGANIASSDVTTALGFTPVNAAGDTMTGDLTFNATKGVYFKDSAGPEKVYLKSPATLAASYNLTWPAAVPTAGQSLQSDASGNLSWYTPASGSGDFKADGTVNMTGTLKAIAGTAALPGYTFVGDTNTGIFAPAADTFGLSTAGVERLRVDGSGNIGIGTSSPTVRLQVSDGGATPTYSAGTDKMAIVGSGNSVLQVTGGNTNGSGIYFSDPDDRDPGGLWYNHLNDSLGLRVNDGIKMLIDANGNVGIGTNTPVGLLHTHMMGASANYMYLTNGTTGGAATDGMYIGSSSTGNAYVMNSEAQSLVLGTSATERVRIDSAGNVGIGTTVPGAPLDVKGAIRMSGSTSGYTGFQPAAAAGSTVWTLPTADGSNGQVLTTNGAGILNWSTPSAGGINSLGGLTAATQTFAVGTAGTAPAFSSVTSTHTLNIPMAATASVTAGLISKAQYDTFNNKLSATITSPTTGQVIRYNGSAWVNAAVNAATDMTGILPVANGGTGASSLGSGNLLVGAGTGAVTSLAAGTAGNIVYASGISTWASATPDTAGLVDKSSTQTISGAKAFTNYVQMSAQNQLRLADSDSTHYVALRSPATVASNVTLTFPATAGTNGQILSTDGTGVMSWVTPAGADNLGNHTAIQKLDLGANNLVGMGGSDGLAIANDGAVSMTGFMKNFSMNQGSITGLARLAINTSLVHQIDVNSNNSSLYTGSSGTGVSPAPTTGIATVNTNPSDGRGAFFHMNAYNTAGTSQSAYLGAVSDPTGNTPTIVIGQQTGANAYTERMRIDSAGKVGIGTLVPTANLHVKQIASNIPFKIEKSDGAEVMSVDFGGRILMDPNVNSTVPMLTIGNGNFGGKLLVLNGKSSNTLNLFEVKHNSVDRMLVTYDGKVGIGTSAPTYQLQLSTDSAAKPGTSTWTIASDERLKDIRAPFNRGLKDLLGINTVYFQYKESNPLGLPSNKEYVGIKAQDAQKSIPESVATDDKGYLHVTNDSIIWTAVNAIKELYAKFLVYETRLAVLKTEADVRVRALEIENAKLKARDAAKDKEIAAMKLRLEKIEKALGGR